MSATTYALSRPLKDPVVIMAFEGWSDAASAASDAVDHLVTMYNAEQIYAVDPSDFYDFQSTRPQVGFDADGNRQISWPTTELLVAEMPGRDLVIVRGPEPNFGWPTYVSAFTEMLTDLQPRTVVILGSLLSENPHTRPVPVSLSTEDPELADRLDAPKPTYEGPTGITGVMSHACQQAGLPTLSVWAACPHYVANPPNPKATLALVSALEDVLGEPIDLGDLPARAEVWEKNVNELAAEDPDITSYIAKLEDDDDARRPQLSGDAIAAEFQRYLRRRESGN